MLGYKRENAGTLYPWQIHDEWIDWLNYSDRARERAESGGEEDDEDEDGEVRI